MTEPKRSYNPALLKSAILTMSFVQMSTNGIAPFLADIARAFPEASTQKVQFLMTFPSIFSVVFMLLSSVLAGRIGKKPLALAGLLVVTAAGLGAVLLHGSLTVLFFWAAVLGTGVGLVCTVAPALIGEAFTGAEERAMLGLQNSAANVGSMLMTFFGGLLAARGWWFGYLVYLLGIPGLICTLVGVPGNGNLARSGEARADAPARFSLGLLWRELLVSFLFMILFSSVPANLSMLAMEKGLGGPQTAGILSTLFLAGGMVAGFCYGAVSGRLGRNTVLLGGLLLALGALASAAFGGVVPVAIACLVGGMSISFLMPKIMEAPGRFPGSGSLVAALIMSASNIGVFCGPLLTRAVNGITGADLAANRFWAIEALSVLLAGLSWALLAKKER